MSAVFPSSENRQHEHLPLAAAGPRVLRVKDAAVRYGVSLSFLWKLARTGRLHPHRVSSRCTLWDVAELDRVLGGTGE